MSVFGYATCFVGPVTAQEESRGQTNGSLTPSTPLQHSQLSIRSNPGKGTGHVRRKVQSIYIFVTVNSWTNTAGITEFRLQSASRVPMSSLSRD